MGAFFVDRHSLKALLVQAFPEFPPHFFVLGDLAADHRVLRVVAFEHAQGVSLEVIQVHGVVGADHGHQCIFNRVGVRVGLQHVFGTVDGGDIGFALHVITRNVHLVHGQGVDLVDHALGGVFDVTAIWKALDQLFKGIE
jgi:hypothetical protein